MGKTVIKIFLGLAVLGLVIGLLVNYLGELRDKVERIETQTANPPVIHVTDNEIDYSHGQKIYVPAYSQMPLFKGRNQNLTVLLSIRNTDPKGSIKLMRVDYYDSKGKLAKAFLNSELTLAPFETKEYFIEQEDPIGGSGANFFIQWSSDGEVYQPYVEALMYGIAGSHSFSFKSEGLVFDEAKETN